MKVINKLKDRKGVSPVIATVIIVAVTITVAVAVAYWMSGIASQYTAFEKVEIQTAICTWEEDATATPVVTGHWKITIQLKNSGTATATLTNVFINDIEVNAYTTDLASPLDVAAETQAATNMTKTELIESGATITVEVFIDGPSSGGQWKSVSSGTTINIKIHSSAGMDYIRLVRLT